ncbi:MAG: hypothetical protein LBU20_02315 [Candidatus Nomurabacteria bacterium]|jgi:hypothetical protein|nr:hypothetical protein [Candidatus Nomurabacteria bacterium]
MSGIGRQAWLNAYRFASLVMLLAIIGAVFWLVLAASAQNPALTPTPTAPTATETESEFVRPSAMEYVSQTNSYVVGGTVVSYKWHTVADGVVYDPTDTGEDGTPPYYADGYVRIRDVEKVDYTTFVFRSDDGQGFEVSDNGKLYLSVGENLGLELIGDSLDATNYRLVRIIWGGK